MWIVTLTVPSHVRNGPATKTTWPFPNKYFPREVPYKKDAGTLTNTAKRLGATNIKVYKE